VPSFIVPWRLLWVPFYVVFCRDRRSWFSIEDRYVNGTFLRNDRFLQIPGDRNRRFLASAILRVASGRGFAYFCKAAKTLRLCILDGDGADCGNARVLFSNMLRTKHKFPTVYVIRKLRQSCERLPFLGFWKSGLRSSRLADAILRCYSAPIRAQGWNHPRVGAGDITTQDADSEEAISKREHCTLSPKVSRKGNRELVFEAAGSAWLTDATSAWKRVRDTYLNRF